VRVKTESPLRVNLNISQRFFQTLTPTPLPRYILCPPSLLPPETKIIPSHIVEQDKPNQSKKNEFQSTGYKTLCDFCEKKLQKANEPEGSPKKPSQSDGRCLCSFHQNKNTHRYKKKNYPNNNFHSSKENVVNLFFSFTFFFLSMNRSFKESSSTSTFHS
jgi:hypothetical protein